MRYTLKLFIEKANIVHSNKFSYDKTVYVKWTEKIIITCPIHGDFEQTPRDHLSGRGCNKCGRATVAGRQRMTVERFIELSNKKHNYKFLFLFKVSRIILLSINNKTSLWKAGFPYQIANCIHQLLEHLLNREL